MNRKNSNRPTRVLAVASAGGHWVQLLRLRPAFTSAEIIYVTTKEGLQYQVEGAKFHVVRDATRWDKVGLLVMLLQLILLVLRARPDVVLTTGAAPGYFALRIGKLLGAKTLWLDSIANSEEMSHSGKLAGKHAHVWLTQWPELAGPPIDSGTRPGMDCGERRNRERLRLAERRPEHQGAVL